MQTASDKLTQMPCQAFVGLTKLCTCIASGTKQCFWNPYIPIRVSAGCKQQLGTLYTPLETIAGRKLRLTNL